MYRKRAMAKPASKQNKTEAKATAPFIHSGERSKNARKAASADGLSRRRSIKLLAWIFEFGAGDTSPSRHCVTPFDNQFTNVLEGRKLRAASCTILHVELKSARFDFG